MTANRQKIVISRGTFNSMIYDFFLHLSGILLDKGYHTHTIKRRKQMLVIRPDGRIGEILAMPTGRSPDTVRLWINVHAYNNPPHGIQAVYEDLKPYTEPVFSAKEEDFHRLELSLKTMSLFDFADWVALYLISKATGDRSVMSGVKLVEKRLSDEWREFGWEDCVYVWEQRALDLYWQMEADKRAAMARIAAFRN